MTSELSGIPLVGFFRLLRHILEPEIGETRLKSDLGVGCSVSDSPGTRNFPFSPRSYRCKKLAKILQLPPHLRLSFDKKDDLHRRYLIYHDQPRLLQLGERL